MTTNAKLLKKEEVAALRAAQDQEAAQFWSYPDEHWQKNFQKQWLLEHGFPATCQDEDGLFWGEELQDSIPLALQQDMRRLKAYFPYRIVYGAISPTGETVAAAVATMHKPNALARKGWAVWRI